MRPVGIGRAEPRRKQPGTATLMELRQLRYFVALAEELHFGRAAERLGIAQPSLSTQIQALEAGLSAQLLSRGPRSVALTAAGAIFLEEARLTLAQADRAVAVGRRAGRGELGIVRIGLALGSTLSGVPSIVMSQYRRRYPEIELVDVPATRICCEPVRPLTPTVVNRTAQQSADTMLDIDDVTGKRAILTSLMGHVRIEAENAAAALEVISQFSVDPLADLFAGDNVAIGGLEAGRLFTTVASSPAEAWLMICWRIWE